MAEETKILKEVIEKIEEVYGNSGYFQHIKYDADAGKENWYSKALKIINKQSKN
ncbi:MAG TPA: hypothetical protein VNG53_02075 [Bacteroidia bacterium]|nr:hypothetical protein [Bacteroidia bacterium]